MKNFHAATHQVNFNYPLENELFILDPEEIQIISTTRDCSFTENEWKSRQQSSLGEQVHLTTPSSSHRMLFFRSIYHDLAFIGFFVDVFDLNEWRFLFSIPFYSPPSFPEPPTSNSRFFDSISIHGDLLCYRQQHPLILEGTMISLYSILSGEVFICSFSLPSLLSPL